MWLFSAFALAVGLALAGWWLGAGRRHGAGGLALAWLGYAGYEALMGARVLCSGECNIRVDLLLLWPALVGGTLVWLGLRLRRARRDRQTRQARRP